MNGNLMPSSKEAEQAVLGSMFLNKYAIVKAVESLNPELFFHDAHKTIFEIIVHLTENNINIDYTTVVSELEKRNMINLIGGVEYLVEITEKVPTALNIDSYISIVLEKAVLRKLIEESSSIANLAYSEDLTLNEILDESEKKIFSVAKARKATEFKTIQDVLFKTQSDLEKLSQTKGEITGVATGFHDFDKLTAGLHGNELIIVAARPAMGKTAFALNVACHVAENSEKAVAVFNMEMSSEQLAMRMLSSIGQIDGNRLRTGNLGNNDWKKVNESISRLAETKLYIDDTSGMSVGEIRAKSRRLASASDGLSLIVIDYLQLISGSSRYSGNRQMEVAEISRALKTLAMELNVPIIALAQLSRSVESREDKRPLLSDLRESGSIEQDADIVAFLYRDDYYNPESAIDENTSKSEFLIRKHRNGPVDTVELLFKRDTSTFRNFSKEE